MRRLLLAAVMFGATAGAQAADMPDFLRGSLPGSSVPTANWQGYYIGGQGGIGTSDMNFTGSTHNVAANLLSGLEMEQQEQVSSWPIMGKVSVHGTGYGFFAGHNSHWTILSSASSSIICTAILAARGPAAGQNFSHCPRATPIV
jgi:outer membrane immunogenic protein